VEQRCELRRDREDLGVRAAADRSAVQSVNAAGLVRKKRVAVLVDGRRVDVVAIRDLDGASARCGGVLERRVRLVLAEVRLHERGYVLADVQDCATEYRMPLERNRRLPEQVV